MDSNDWDILEAMLEEWIDKYIESFEKRQSLIPIRDFIFERTSVGKRAIHTDWDGEVKRRIRDD